MIILLIYISNQNEHTSGVGSSVGDTVGTIVGFFEGLNVSGDSLGDTVGPDVVGLDVIGLWLGEDVTRASLGLFDGELVIGADVTGLCWLGSGVASGIVGASVWGETDGVLDGCSAWKKDYVDARV